ncbi:glycosyltransferase family 4 protein [Chitinolyticbacter albus]|uniref:glycosyltransferase family 4 protein n=1 Tax=Chitinolyticbacter albus TaxID=2961951 RepID=UPI00210BA63D|nr:glycosyltransferase family 4 protein [Chitinolyticbacter albus]
MLKIQMMVEADIATTQLLERVLMECASYGLSYKKTYINGQKKARLDDDALPLFVRNADPIAASLCKCLKQNGWPYCYYLDDNFWEISGDTALARYYQDASIRRSLGYIVQNAALVLVNSEQLAKYIRNKFGCVVQYLPPMFDFSLLNGVQPYAGDEVRIGFAGSSSRVADLEVLAPLVGPILEKFPEVVFEFAGAMPASVGTSDRVRFFSYVGNYQEFIKFQYARGWKIGLAPLVADGSNGFKTNNKFREYAACGIVGIYSDSPSYRDSVKHLDNGFVVASYSAPAWMAAIECLLNNPELRENMAAKAFQYVSAHYALSVITKDWVAALMSFSPKIAELKSGGVNPGWISAWSYVQSHVLTYWLLTQQARTEGGWRLVLKKILFLLKKRLAHARE